MFVCAQCGQRHERAGYCATDGTPLVETDDPLLGTEIERYRLARLLGEGGMGRVYLAVQPAIGSRVAIKLLSEQCARNPELLERFFAEAKAVNLIRHEHIVSVLDMAQLPDGRPFIVMEFVEGQTLASVVRSIVAPLGGLVQVMGEVLSALSAAHAIGIVHRDLKPDNILVTVEGHAKVLDFGIAKLAPGMHDLSPRTRTGALLGTPAYMAPEQISGAANVDARADLYAAGIVLFEAVTGHVPFSGATIFDIMRAHVDQQPPAPSASRPDLPPALEQVILTALAKHPAQRFQSAAAMAQALTHAAASLPADQWRPLSTRSGVATPRVSGISAQRSAPPAPATAAAPTFARPRRLGLIIGALVVAMLAAGTTLIALSSSSDHAPSGPAIASAPITAPAPVTAPAPAPVPAPGPGPAPVPVPAPGPAPVPVPAPAPAPARAHRPAVAPIEATGTAPAAAAADHGVHVGSNVHIGSNVVIGGQPATPSPSPALPPTAPATPTHFTRPASYNPRQFNATAFLPTALALARQVYSDAGFTRFDVYYVFPDGHADLTAAHDDSSYLFRSPSHSARPANIPANVETDIACYVEVTVHPTEIDVRARGLDPIDPSCKWPIRPLPRCTLAAIWSQAHTAGAALDTIAKIAFLSDGQWFFDNEGNNTGFVKSLPDRCP